MADEQAFIHDGLQRSQIDEFFASELGRAGYGGMEVAKTPMGTQIVLKAEKPGMVIGKGGKNIRKITAELEERFDLDDPQIDVQEVDEPDLNARIVADRLANALERGWYFRKAGHTTLERIMDSGALGAEIVLSGKVTGARSRVEKFNDGYIKHNGEPAAEIVDRGQATAVMKLGTIGVDVKIIPPGAELPDDFRVREGADVEDLIPEAGEAGVEEVLGETAATPGAGGEAAVEEVEEAVEAGMAEPEVEEAEPEVEEVEAEPEVEEVEDVEAEVEEAEPEAETSESEAESEIEDIEAKVEEAVEAEVEEVEAEAGEAEPEAAEEPAVDDGLGELDEEVAERAREIVAEMEDEEGDS